MKDVVNFGKFQDFFVIVKGDICVYVLLSDLQMFWFNMGMFCNIECENCYIFSFLINDVLVYLMVDEIIDYLDQFEDCNWGVCEIVFIGGEFYMNFEMNEMICCCLECGYDVFVLINVMMLMQCKKVKEGFLELNVVYSGKLIMCILVDYWFEELYDKECGKGSFGKIIIGMEWLSENGFFMVVVGCIVWEEIDVDFCQGYVDFYVKYGFDIDLNNSGMIVFFLEMDEIVEVFEIIIDCWGILNK